MSFMKWLPSFELGIEEFDEHHKHLVHLLNMTYDGLSYGAEHDELGAVLDELIGYAMYHFAAEEHWMKMHEYPVLLEHIGEHEKFCKRIVTVQNDFHRGKSNLGIEVVQFLNSWLADHILETDAEYGRFVSKRVEVSFAPIKGEEHAG